MYVCVMYVCVLAVWLCQTFAADVKRNIGEEVECTAPFSDGEEERGVVKLTMLATATE